MGSAPTCLSCGSLFVQNDDEVQEQLRRQTPVVDKPSSRLNLDWPSSITFSTSDDVTDPELRRILLHLYRYTEVAESKMPSETNPSFMGDSITEAIEVERGTVADSSQGIAEPLKSGAPADDPRAQTFIKAPNLHVVSGSVKPSTTSQIDVYRSLTGIDEIRLLHLDPQVSDNASEPLHGCLRPTGLSQRPDYIALSYTWADATGDRVLRDTIFLGNAWEPFAITRNCAAALRRLRLRGGPRVVWIDAICIDQTNIGERSHQVSMMRDIYSRAQSVAIFLGGDANKKIDTPAGRLMERLSDDRFRAGRAVTNNWGGDFDYQGIRDLFGQPYWSRIWVIQEVLLARRGEIILGSATVPLNEFIENFMKKFPLSVESLPLWIYSHGPSPFGDVDAFSDLLDKTSTCESSDERDMVFALFGLLQGANLEGLVADYSKTLAEIYTGLAAYFLIRHGQSGLLKAAASAATIEDKAASLGIHDDHAWHHRLASWVPFGRLSPKRHEVHLFEIQEPPTFDEWCRMFATTEESERYKYFHLTGVQPRSCEPLETALSTYKVFGNHGTLLIRARPVVHLSSMDSAPSNSAFSLNVKAYRSSIYVLTATGSPMPWEICIYTEAVITRDDDWIIEVPGCDTFLHLKSSGRVPGTYKIVSPSSVLLARNKIIYMSSVFFGRSDHTTELPSSNGLSGPVFEDMESSAGNAAEDYRLWMPLVSCNLQHLHFLRRWESITQMDSSVAPRQSRPEDAPAVLSPEVLEEYGRWQEVKDTPEFGDGLHHGDFDPVLRTVSLYLERWDDCQLWSKIHEIVVEVPWQEKLRELADIKADAGKYFATRNHSKTDHCEDSAATFLEYRIQILFSDLVGRLSGPPTETVGVAQSLGRSMSTETCLSMRNSIRNEPDSWDMDQVQTNEAEIFKTWTEVESCWAFMEQSKADCQALQGKFAQLRTLKRLCRREQRDFLIC
ncbi:heterokaryon incompatibility protein-domain-containing protein [Diaporthe sp. PMI_573]|nr:heterokaryon incompatibility protein-domain-containing protein [Diaporthaceae sp. PMI_573]